MRAMSPFRLALLSLLLMPFFTVSPVRSGEAVVSTMRNVNAVMEARGFYLTPAPELSGTMLQGDHAPVMAMEIIRPGGEPVTIGRLYTSCTCVRLEASQRKFERGERAVLNFRNVLPTPPQGQNYAMYVQITSPIRTTLRYDVFVQSMEFRPQSATAAEPAKSDAAADAAKLADAAKTAAGEAAKHADAAEAAAGSIKIPTPPEVGEIEVGGKKMVLLTPKADKLVVREVEKKEETAGKAGEAKGEEKAEAKTEEKAEAKTEEKGEEKAEAAPEAKPEEKAEAAPEKKPAEESAGKADEAPAAEDSGTVTTEPPEEVAAPEGTVENATEDPITPDTEDNIEGETEDNIDSLTDSDIDDATDPGDTPDE